MVPESPFVSYSQNREDVVLARALSHVDQGRYVDVGANDPVADSVTYAFYLRRWTGITVEPVPAWAQRQRELRPDDYLVEAAIVSEETETVTLHSIANTGLSTLVDEVGASHQNDGWDVEDIVVPAKRLDDVLHEAGWADLDIHFMVIDTEGAERAVLESFDLKRWRPWILVVEATKPQTTEPSHDAWEAIVTGRGLPLLSLRRAISLLRRRRTGRGPPPSADRPGQHPRQLRHLSRRDSEVGA